MYLNFHVEDSNSTLGDWRKAQEGPMSEEGVDESV